MMLQGKNKRISLVSVGRSASGKSSIGNVFLGSKNHWDGPFKTGATPYSCTKVSSAKSNYENTRVYTDLPGIPDTDPTMTATVYDVCIEELKKPHTAVLFIFEYERINVEDFKLAELLFREINKVKCEKILVINDRKVYHGDRPAMDDYQELANRILLHTKINVAALVVIDSVSSMETQLNQLASSLEGIEATASPDLKSFVELGKWINTLKGKADFHHEALKDLKNALRNRRIAKVAFKVIKSVIDIAGFFLAGPMDPTTGTVVFTPIMLTAAEGSKDNTKDKKKHCMKERLDMNKAALDRAVKELKDAMDHYLELKAKMGRSANG